MVRKFLFFVMALLVISANVMAQITYTADVSGYTSPHTTNVNCSFGTSHGNNILVMGVVINGNEANFVLKKYSGSFSNSGTGYITDETVCGSVLAQIDYSAGIASMTIKVPLNFTSGTKTYVGRVFSNNATNDRFHTLPIKITAVATKPNVTTEYAIPAQDRAELGGKVSPNGTATYYWFEYGTSSSNLSSKSSKTFSGSGTGTYTETATITGLKSETIYYYRIAAENAGGTSYGSIENFTTVKPWTAPTISSVSATNITENSVTLSAYVNPNGFRTATLFEYGTSSSNLSVISESMENIGSGTTKVYITVNKTLLASNTTYYYRVSAGSTDGSGEMNYVNSSVYSFKTKEITPFKLELASPIGFYETSSDASLVTTLELGKTYNFRAKVKNTGGMSFSGNFYVKKGLGASYSNYVAMTDGTTIRAGGTVQLSGTFIPTVEESNIVLGLYYSDTGSNQGQVTGGGYPSTITISIRNQVFGGCDLSGIDPASAYYEATRFLCERTVLSGSSDDGSVNVNNLLKRSHLAKIAFRGLYKLYNRNVPASVPSDYYPIVYFDLAQHTSENDYYYQAARALLYLEYGDGISPFDRNRLRFDPENAITRVDVLKVLMEAFNIKPNVSGTNNPFPDDPDAISLKNYQPLKFGYIRRAASLGIIATPSGSQNTKFRPYDECLRGEAFIMLANIMKKIEAGSISDPNPTNIAYYEPINITLQTLALGLGLPMGNFNHYTKTSFNIDGIVPLFFAHEYNSYNTSLPDEFYGEKIVNNYVSTYKPLGPGWSHNYHSYVTLVGTGNDARAIIHWGGGTIHVYKSNGSKFIPESIGVYDDLQLSGSEVVITSKSQREYRFSKREGTGPSVLHLESVTDRNGNTLTLNYGANFNGTMVLQSVSDGSRSLSFSYKSGTNLIESVSDPLGRTVNFSYTYNSNFDEFMLTSFTDAKGQITNYTYGDVGNFGQSRLLERIQLPKGNYIENQYEANRRLSQTVAGINGVPKTQTSVTVSANYSGTVKTNSTVGVQRDGVTSYYTYQYNQNNMVTGLNGSEGLSLSASYSNNTHLQLPTSIQTNSTNMNDIQYDSQGNVTQMSISASDGSGTLTRKMTYNSTNDITSITDPKGNKINFYYDSRGNLTSVSAPEGVTSSITVNSKGLPTKVTDPEGMVTQFSYNIFGNLTELLIPALGVSSSMQYDNASRLTAVTDFKNNRSSFSYDNNDNLLSETNALNHITQYNYDANDNLTLITNANGGVTSLNYEIATDWLTSVSFAGATKSYAYNKDGTLSSFTKPDGTMLNYTYDDLGRVLSDGVNSYSYDSKMRISALRKDGKTLSLEYDGFNRVNRVSYNDVSNNVVQYGYDANGNITSMTYPGGKLVTYSYDGLDRLISLTDWNNKTIHYYYRKDSKLSRVEYPNGMRLEYSYDNAGRMIAQTTKKSNGSIIAGYYFTLDEVGNIIEQNANEPYSGYNIDPSGITNYTYNSANRIQKAGDINFSFDANGNTTKRGNENYSWDTSDKLVQAAGKQITYGPMGNIRSNGSTRYFIDIMGMGNVLAETDNSGNVTAYYLHGVGLEAKIKPDGTTYYYVSDYRGSTVAMLDNNANITHKYQYDEFGKLMQEEEIDFNPFRYIGKFGVIYNNENLYYMRARHYDPTIGRFLSEDPIWSTNLYPYADNNPVLGIDPQGEKKMSISELESEIRQRELRINYFLEPEKSRKDAKEAKKLTNEIEKLNKQLEELREKEANKMAVKNWLQGVKNKVNNFFSEMKLILNNPAGSWEGTVGLGLQKTNQGGIFLDHTTADKFGHGGLFENF